MNRSRLLVPAVTVLLAGLATPVVVRAQSYNFSFSGPGVGGSLMLSYSAATDSKYPNAFEVTGVSGTFFDATAHILSTPVGSLVAINHATPETTNLLAPNDFSKYAVASGLPAQSHGFVSYDNLFWPAGSPQTASDYPPSGGFLDIYGLLFNIGNGQVVNIWSNGVGQNGHVDYGASVSTANNSLDYVAGGVTAVTTTPEPGTLWLVGSGLVGMAGLRRRRALA